MTLQSQQLTLRLLRTVCALLLHDLVLRHGRLGALHRVFCACPSTRDVFDKRDSQRAAAVLVAREFRY